MGKELSEYIIQVQALKIVGDSKSAGKNGSDCQKVLYQKVKLRVWGEVLTNEKYVEYDCSCIGWKWEE
jgi:hypothetical protein